MPERLEARVVPLPLSTPIRVPTGEHTWEEVLRTLRGILGDRSTKKRWEEVYKRGLVFPPDVVVCDVIWVEGIGN